MRRSIALSVFALAQNSFRDKIQFRFYGYPPEPPVCWWLGRGDCIARIVVQDKVSAVLRTQSITRADSMSVVITVNYVATENLS